MKSNTKIPRMLKSSSQEINKGQDEKELKSKWVAKAGVALVLYQSKILTITIQPAKH